jgi:hypothetical protein
MKLFLLVLGFLCVETNAYGQPISKKAESDSIAYIKKSELNRYDHIDFISKQGVTTQRIFFTTKTETTKTNVKFDTSGITVIAHKQTGLKTALSGVVSTNGKRAIVLNCITYFPVGNTTTTVLMYNEKGIKMWTKSFPYTIKKTIIAENGSVIALLGEYPTISLRRYNKLISGMTECNLQLFSDNGDNILKLPYDYYSNIIFSPNGCYIGFYNHRKQVVAYYDLTNLKMLQFNGYFLPDSITIAGSAFTKDKNGVNKIFNIKTNN